MKREQGIANKPTRRVDFIHILLMAYRPSWGVTRSDIREMSLKSLKDLYNRVNREAIDKVMRGE